jgi:thiamine biosynthesis lipoprotein
VQLRSPFLKASSEILLSEDSLSTSEQSPKSLLGDRQTGHIINPQTGKRVDAASTVSALAKTATDSDALSTTLFLLGPQQGKQLLEESPGIGAVWISSSGQMKVVSKTTKRWLLEKVTAQNMLDPKAEK